MALVEWDCSDKTVTAWAKQMWKEHSDLCFFALPFFTTPPKPIPWYRSWLNMVQGKLEDIKAGLKIIFKGEYPDDGLDY